MKFTSCLFALLIIAFSLSAQEKDDAYFEQLAIELCDCSTPFLELMDKVMSAAQKGDVQQAEKIIANLEEEELKLNTCISVLEKKYPEINTNPEYEKRTLDALRVVCPKFIKAMESTGETFEASEEPASLEDTTLEDDESYVDVDIADVAIEEVYSDAYYEGFANQVCDCVNTHNEVMEKYQSLSGEDKDAKQTAFRRTMQDNYPEFYSCLDKVERNYTDGIDGSIDKRTKAIKAIQAACPDYNDLMGVKMMD